MPSVNIAMKLRHRMNMVKNLLLPWIRNESSSPLFDLLTALLLMTSGDGCGDGYGCLALTRTLRVVVADLVVVVVVLVVVVVVVVVVLGSWVVLVVVVIRSSWHWSRSPAYANVSWAILLKWLVDMQALLYQWHLFSSRWLWLTQESQELE